MVDPDTGAPQYGTGTGATVRLNKVLAHAGVASRRHADDLIQDGRVSVNGNVVSEPGTQVDPRRDVVRVDGQTIPSPQRQVHLVLYKPRFVVSTTSDPAGRATVTDLVDGGARLYPAGRLDYESEGLLILTNDGDLANRLMHPRYGHEREYRVKISSTPNDSALAAWRNGMFLEDGKTRPADVRIESTTGGGTWLRFVLREGRNRQVRRMIEAMHHTVHRLIRVRIGPVQLGTLQPGQSRVLTDAELSALTSSASGTATADESGQKDAGAAHAGRKRYLPGWARPKVRPPRRGRGRAPSAKRPRG